MKQAAVAIAAGLSLVAGLAHAEPTFDLFQKLCAAPAGDRAASLAAADAMGWAPMPRDLLETLGKNQTGSSQKAADLEGRISMEGGLHALMLARLSEVIPGQPAPGDACAVAVTVAGPDAAAIRAEVLRFAGVPADPALTDTPADLTFGWREQNGKHIRVSAADFGHANGRRDLRALGFTATGGFALIGLAIPSK